MKEHDLVFTPKSIFILLLLMSIMLVTSITYAQELQSSGVENTNQEELEANTPAYNAWMLAIQYRFDELPEGAEIVQDPPILKQIANLRGDELRYFLDSIQAINQVQNTLFPPASPNSKGDMGMIISEQRKLVDIVTANVFSTTGGNDTSLTKLSERDQVYVSELQTILEAIVKGNGDTFFTANYLAYRTEIIPFIENTGAELFSPSHEAMDKYIEYFGSENKQLTDLDPTSESRQGCSITNTVENWPSESSLYYGNTGSSWYEGQESDPNQTDCDIWIRYYMGPTVHYGQISAGTSSAQCVLDKINQLTGDWSNSMIYNYVQYGKVRVTSGWPLGCNTTGSDLMSATKWRP